ncbi:hypothetical protein NL676_014464 [Syzygium grande]|nr:hypothetical protein NL676_014464 [Syzygium grande]
MEGSSVTLTPKRLDGKVAIITGGASGIGESTVRLFVWHVSKVVVADIQDNLGQSLCDELGTKDAVLYVHGDVTSDDDVKNVVDFAVAEYGKLDIMHNNAGISGKVYPMVHDYDNKDLKRVLNVNAYGAFLGAKHAARVMIPAKRGVILFTASMASVCCGISAHACTASKHAVVGLMKNLCIELGPYGIRVNAISPRGITTPLFLNVMGLEKSKIEEALCTSVVLKGVVLEAEDVAEAALYLSGNEAKYASGLNLVVDGGYTCTNQSLMQAPKSVVP